MFTGVVYAIAAAMLIKMIYVSKAHQATDTAVTVSASLTLLDATRVGTWVGRVAGRRNGATSAGSRVAEKMTGPLFESKPSLTSEY